MDQTEWRRLVRASRSRIFSLALGSPQRMIVTGMVVALVITMGVIGASGKLLQPIPSYNPYVNQSTFHVRVNPDAIPLGASTNITATVTSYMHDSTVEVSVSVLGPSGSVIMANDTAVIHTNSHGTGSVTLQFPGNFNGIAQTSAEGTYTVVASFAQVYTSVMAYGHFTVYKGGQSDTPDIFMSPGFGPAGTLVTVNGYNFAVDSSITVYYDAANITPVGSAIVTNSQGFFSAKIQVPASSGNNTVRAVDSLGDNASSVFSVQQLIKPGAMRISTISAPVVNGSLIANFTSTVGLGVLLMGTDSSGGLYSQITASLYSGMPMNVMKPDLKDTQYYDLQILNATGGNATISINAKVVNDQAATTMMFWNGTDWISAESVSVSGNTITGIIPVKDLGGTPLVIGQVPGPSYFSVYVAIFVLDTAIAIAIPAAMITRRRRKK